MKGAIVVGDRGAGSSSDSGAPSSSVGAAGLSRLALGGLGIAADSFLLGVYVGRRREGGEPGTAALAGMGAGLVGVLILLAVVTKLLLGW